MYIMGENPAMSDPDANHARESLAALEHLVVQDIFLTETAYLADVILRPAAFPEKTGTFTNTDSGMVQLGPPGPSTCRVDARQDLWIIQEDRAPRSAFPGTTRMSAKCSRVAGTMPSIGGITWDRLEREHSVPTLAATKATRGKLVVFVENFPRPDGRGRFVPADIIPADERPDAEYPMVLITGRQWNTGTPAA
jgi:formate dehydrogenase major subunit